MPNAAGPAVARPEEATASRNAARTAHLPIHWQECNFEEEAAADTRVAAGLEAAGIAGTVHTAVVAGHAAHVSAAGTVLVAVAVVG